MQMLFNFWGNQHLYLALARQAAAPLVKAFQELPPVPPTGQWANFVRNHDELTLDQLTSDQQDEIAAAFAPIAIACGFSIAVFVAALPP